MPDYVDQWRVSSNVQKPRADGLRTMWLGEAAMAPDDYRSSWGLTALTPQTRDAAMAIYAPEQPYIGGADYFGHGRPAVLEQFGEPLAPLGQSFMDRNDRARLAQDVGGMLTQGAGADPIASAIQGALARLGAR